MIKSMFCGCLQARFATNQPTIRWPLLLGLAAMFPTGCDRTGEALRQPATENASVTKFVSASQSPRWMIDECVRTYQHLKSYQDDGFVRLQYRLDGELLEDRAPLSVGWDIDGNLGLRVYAVEAGPDSGRWRLRIRDEDIIAANQVLSRGRPKHVDFEWLLSEPLVAERLGAGLAGFPPQLDLLLSQQALKNLVDDAATLSFRQPQSINGHVCQVINVQRGPAVFGLWIEEATMLLRRLELPRSHLTEDMLADQRVSDIRLTIEFANVRTNEQVDWSKFAIASQENELRVSRFVPTAPVLDTTDLGEKLPAFFLESADGQVVYTSGNGKPGRKATVLMWLADHPACRVAAEQLATIASQLSQHGIAPGAVEFVPIWAEPEPPEGSTFETLQNDWNLPGAIALDREAMGRDLFQVYEAPTLVVVDENNRLQLRESRSNPILDQLLPQLLARLLQGEDLARTMLRQQSNLSKHFEAELRMAAAIDADAHGLPAEMEYGPLAFDLIELSREPSKTRAVATAVDSNSTVWTLYEDGKLRQREMQGSLEKNFTTNWRVADQSQLRISVSPTSQYVVLGTHEPSGVQVFDCATEQNRTIELGKDALLRDFQWLDFGAAEPPRLAVITDDGQTLLIDPTNREQLSGRCPVEPVALLPAYDQEPTRSAHVVLADGSVEPLQLASTLGDHSSGGAVHPAAHTTPRAASLDGRVPAKLGFQPDYGPWVTWRDGDLPATLASGWLAKDEPAMFMLDHKLQRLWHYRMPLQANKAWALAAVANDPASGQAVWVVSSNAHTLHVLRADGMVTDHFSLPDALVGVALVPSGSRLIMIVVHPQETIHYALRWN